MLAHVIVYRLYMNREIEGYSSPCPFFISFSIRPRPRVRLHPPPPLVRNHPALGLIHAGMDRCQCWVYLRFWNLGTFHCVLGDPT